MPDARGFGLYVHWPFCLSKCPYCDFNSHVALAVDQGRWTAALRREIARVSDETGPRVLDTIFFGGGTPSLMAPETVRAVIDAARAAWLPANDMEITLEANPTSVEAGRFRAYAEAGVNRVSIGVQALRDADLRALGRRHSVSEAKYAVELAQSIFPLLSFDLIYARQDQTLADWHSELVEALAMAADHLSLYQLTIEPGTAFGQRHAAGGLRGLPDEDLAADMYALTRGLTDGAGMPAYEISNHARPGGASRHNLIYWRSGDWAGIGPGAHGRLTLGKGRFATESHLAPDTWLGAAESAGSGESARSQLTEQEIREEALLMGLRLSEGLALDAFDEINVIKINMLTDDGWIESVDGRLRATPQGRPVLNAILRELLA